jgi:hypothetical protein
LHKDRIRRDAATRGATLNGRALVLRDELVSYALSIDEAELVGLFLPAFEEYALVPLARRAVTVMLGLSKP